MSKNDSSIALIFLGVIALSFILIGDTEKLLIDHISVIMKYSLVMILVYMSFSLILIGVLMAKGVLTSRYIQGLTVKQKAKNKFYPIIISLPVVIYFFYTVITFSSVFFWKVVWAIVFFYLVFELFRTLIVLKR